VRDLRVCPVCDRHVDVRERACPFCASALPPGRARRIVLAGRVSRAMVFGAALVACGDDPPAQPAPAPVQQGTDDDLEKMLDTQGAQRAPDPAAPIDAALADAAEVDAAVPDAGVDAAAERKRKADLAEKRRKQQRERERKELEEQKRMVEERIHNAKPYGAPPARRRVV
jgi:hypothetical protein